MAKSGGSKGGRGGRGGSLIGENVTDEELRNMFDRWGENLTDREREMLERYQNNSSGIAAYLRGELKDPDDKAYYKNIVDGILSAINKGRIEEDIVTYRGVSRETFNRLGWKEGQTVREKSVLSTTIDKIVARDEFARGESGYVIKLTVPKGTKGAYLNANPQNVGRFSYQKELLLAPGTKFKITSIKDGIIEATIVG